MKQFLSRIITFCFALLFAFSTNENYGYVFASNDASLDSLMKSWQVTMEQYYYSYTPDFPVYVNGVSVPDELLYHVKINNQPVQMVWYEEGQQVEPSTYQVTAVYIENQQNVVYIFTLYKGQPVALVNDQFLYENVADGFNFSETANVNLKQRYDHLYR